MSFAKYFTIDKDSSSESNAPDTVSVRYNDSPCMMYFQMVSQFSHFAAGVDTGR